MLCSLQKKTNKKNKKKQGKETTDDVEMAARAVAAVQADEKKPTENIAAKPKPSGFDAALNSLFGSTSSKPKEKTKKDTNISEKDTAIAEADALLAQVTSSSAKNGTTVQQPKTITLTAPVLQNTLGTNGSNGNGMNPAATGLSQQQTPQQQPQQAQQAGNQVVLNPTLMMGLGGMPQILNPSLVTSTQGALSQTQQAQQTPVQTTQVQQQKTPATQESAQATQQQQSQNKQQHQQQQQQIPKASDYGIADSFKWDAKNQCFFDAGSQYYYDIRRRLYYFQGNFYNWDDTTQHYVIVPDPAQQPIYGMGFTAANALLNPMNMGGMFPNVLNNGMNMTMAMQQQHQQQQQQRQQIQIEKKPVSFGIKKTKISKNSLPKNDTSNSSDSSDTGSQNGNNKKNLNDLFANMNDKEFLNKCLNDSQYIAKYDFLKRSQNFLYTGYNRGHRLICCLLCRRKFKSIDDLKNHDSMSLLHESNLIKWMKKKVKNDILDGNGGVGGAMRRNQSIFERNSTKLQQNNSGTSSKDNSNNNNGNNNGRNGKPPKKKNKDSATSYVFYICL